ncbi:MAG: hypothetical protein ACT4NX_09820 [Deltaproteobacteria bacterium]
MSKAKTRAVFCLSLLIVGVFIFACAKKPPEADIAAGVDPRVLLGDIRRSQEGVKSVKAVASVTIIYPDMKLSFSQVTVAQEPNLVYLQALAPFGKSALTLISDGRKIHLISPKERRTFDSSDEFDLSSVYPGLRAKLSVGNLVNLLLGRAPSEVDWDTSEVKLSADSNRLILSVSGGAGGGQTVFWVDPATGRVERAKIIPADGSAEMVAEFKDFIATSAAPPGNFPTKMELTSGDFFISLSYPADVQLNAQIDRKLYEPPPSKKGRAKKKRVS